MTPSERYLQATSRERPSYPAGTRQAVAERDTPLGFEHPSCYFCKATVLPDEFAIHHEVPWVMIKEYLVNDFDFQASTPEEKAEAINYVYGYLDNLRAAHRACNAADGFKWRDREAWRRHEKRLKEEPDIWNM